MFNRLGDETDELIYTNSDEYRCYYVRKSIKAEDV